MTDEYCCAYEITGRVLTRQPRAVESRNEMAGEPENSNTQPQCRRRDAEEDWLSTATNPTMRRLPAQRGAKLCRRLTANQANLGARWAAVRLQGALFQ